VASLSQGRTAAAQCGLFTHKSVPVIFEPPYITGCNAFPMHHILDALNPWEISDIPRISCLIGWCALPQHSILDNLSPWQMSDVNRFSETEHITLLYFRNTIMWRTIKTKHETMYCAQERCCGQSRHQALLWHCQSIPQGRQKPCSFAFSNSWNFFIFWKCDLCHSIAS